MRITLVGPCASGKSVLAHALRARGYDAHQCSQEHSCAPDMWRRVCRSDVLIYLDAGLDAIRSRRQIDWDVSYLQILQDRLRDARQHCDFYVLTDNLTSEQVLEQVLEFLAGIEE